MLALCVMWLMKIPAQMCEVLSDPSSVDCCNNPQGGTGGADRNCKILVTQQLDAALYLI